jgi:hypothetical protein
MNERIKELAKEAGMTNDKYGMYFAKDKHNEDGVDLEEFARLMIVEIVGLTVTELDYHTYYETNRDKVEAFLRAERLIKEHFGVEE